MDTTGRSFSASRLARRGLVLIAVVALAALAAVMWPSGDSDTTPDDLSRSAAPPTSAAPAGGGPSVAREPREIPTAAPVAAPATPGPVLEDGRHPVYLTDIDVPGSTVEFDLLRYLSTDAERETYASSHPHHGDASHGSPFGNDNPRLRRLPVMPDITVVVQQSGPEGCDGEHMMDYAAFSENLRGRSYEIGHMGTNPFWLTVHGGTVVSLDEMPCAG
jgi:hypothetical protein